MDSEFWYFFEKSVGELVNDQIPDDYEEEVDDPRRSQGRIRCCHGLIDRRQPDSIKLAILMEEKLFQQSSSYTPSGQEVPARIRADCICEIVNFTESLLRDERNMNRNKFLIVAKFGVFTTMRDINDDDEIGFVPASKSSIEGLEKVSGLGDSECAICLEKRKKELAKRMPCGHIYHGDCINQWLKKSHLCPLCRYPMPT